MTENVLRARSVTELVDAAVQLLRRHYVPIIMVSAIGVAPWFVLQPFLTQLVEGDSSAVSFSGFFTALLLILLASIWYSLAGAAIISAAAQGYLEGRVDVGAAIGKAASRVGPVLYSSFVKGFAIFIGLFAFLVGSLYFYATYFAVPTTVMLEPLSGGAGLERSKQLATGNRWHVLKTMGLVLFIYLCIMIATGIMTALVFGRASSTLTEIISRIVTILVYPIVPITEMLVYYDLRIRVEGYDVEVMASKLDAAGAAPAS